LCVRPTIRGRQVGTAVQGVRELSGIDSALLLTPEKDMCDSLPHEW
jgi:hypothetical protein